MLATGNFRKFHRKVPVLEFPCNKFDYHLFIITFTSAIFQAFEVIKQKILHFETTAGHKENLPGKTRESFAYYENRVVRAFLCLESEKLFA